MTKEELIKYYQETIDEIEQLGKERDVILDPKGRVIYKRGEWIIDNTHGAAGLI